MSLLALDYLLRDQPMQTPLRRRPGIPGDRCCCCRSACRAIGVFHPHAAEVAGAPRRSADRRGRRCACSRSADTAAPGGAAAVQRPLPRHGHQRRRRLQPLGRPGGHALARGRHPRPLGQLLLPARRRQRRVLVDRATSRRCVPVRRLRGDLLRRQGRVPRPPARLRDPHRDRGLARGRHRAAPPAHHQPLAQRAHRSRSPATPKSCWRRRSPTSCTRRSATCSCRPNWCRRSRRSCARGGRARTTRRRRGCSTCWPCTTRDVDAISYETDRARFVGRGNTLRDPRALTSAGRAVEHRRLGARSDRRDPLPRSRWRRNRPRPSTWSPASAETREACDG